MTVLKVNRLILKKITNPSVEPYEIEIDTQEFTFYGAKNQPDFASINISMIPGKSVIELKSFKLYFHQYRNKLASYERIINTIYDDLIQVYKPKRLVIEMKFNSRGGVSSKLTIDSFERELFIERKT